MENIELQMIEYESLRIEMMDSIKARNQIVSYGLATLGFIIGGIATLIVSPTYKFAAGYVMIYVLPTISVAILFAWLGEVGRMMRAGNHVKELEEKINEERGKEILTWEINRRDNKIQTHYAYFSILFLFLFIAGFPFYTFFFLGTTFFTMPHLIMPTILIGVFSYIFLSKYQDFTNHPKHK